MRSSRSNRRKSVRKPVKLPRLSLRLDPRILRWPAAALLALVFAVAVRGALDQPVRTLVVEGQLERVTATQVEAALGDALHGGLLALNLDKLRKRVEAIDWVDDVWLRRAWPDRLLVRVGEHHAAARWGEHGLLDIHGERFTDDARYPYPELPKLDGPEGSEHVAAAYYLSVRDRLIEAGLALDTLDLDGRGAVRITLASGQEIRFGREEVAARIDRFFTVVVPALGLEFARVRYVDLRYTNGFAVSWKERPRVPETLSMEATSRG